MTTRNIAAPRLQHVWGMESARRNGTIRALQHTRRALQMSGDPAVPDAAAQSSSSSFHPLSSPSPLSPSRPTPSLLPYFGEPRAKTRIRVET
jgi:hypothetical protein